MDSSASSVQGINSTRHTGITFAGEEPPQPALSSGNVVRCDIMIKFLRQRQLEKLWSDGNSREGVVLKRARFDFICQPDTLTERPNGFFDEVRKLNVKVCMTVKTEVIKTFLKSSTLPYVPFEDGLQLQVLPNIRYLSRCKKHHFAAFIKVPGLLVVWDDDPEAIIARAEQIEEHLVGLLWKNLDMRDETDFESALSKMTLNNGSNPNVSRAVRTTSSLGNLKRSATPTVSIHEVNEPAPLEFSSAPRKTILWQSILTAIAGTLIVFAMGTGVRKVLIEVKVDHYYTRLALIAVAPLQMWLGWFFFQTLVVSVAQILGPVNQCSSNSRNYSGVRSPRINRACLPHITVQCPVYKEGLWAVIHPTMASIRAAISTYEMQGGTANIFVNDDGMQLLPAAEAQERREYYEEHNIGWVARPKHNPGKKGESNEKTFVRAGKFKKASNMNYGMGVSARIEDKLAKIERNEDWTQQLEDTYYHKALAEVIEEDQGRTWAEGDVRIGDYILIIDSDTRVPVDCFLDAVSEMELSPQVAIIQFSSGVMNVTNSFFEKGITYFTHLVYTAIRFAVANGDVAPFVGHNAILRWSAIQDISYPGENGIDKYWAENTVSEDFDMALRLQSKGYDLRFATYYEHGFQEGVSLTVYDELARWEKYAYGCSELVFNPFKDWLFHGPFTKLFRNFITSGMPVMAKLTIISYIGTYFAIGSSWILTVANYFLIGWYNGYLDHYYLDSFKVWFAVVVIFQASGVVCLAILRYRVEGRSLIGSLIENLTWLPLLTIFLGGISLHVSQALICHLFSIDMSWGATSKEAKRTSFFEEIPNIIRTFKFTFIFCAIMTGAMITLAGIGPLGHMVPWDWQINEFTPIFPLSTIVGFHFLLPLVLNPGLMQFTF